VARPLLPTRPLPLAPRLHLAGRAPRANQSRRNPWTIVTRISA
jgi:hypothetical protein